MDDKYKLICTQIGSISLDRIKSLYIAEGLSAQEITERTSLPIEQVLEIIEKESLQELRKAYILQGIQKIQSVQLYQVNKLLDLETDFKKMRILQLEADLKNYLAYYARYSDFYKRHPITGEILKTSEGIPMQIKLPKVSSEILQLKESVMMSEGVRTLLSRLNEIINTPIGDEVAEDPDAIDVDFKTLFGTSED